MDKDSTSKMPAVAKGIQLLSIATGTVYEYVCMCEAAYAYLSLYYLTSSSTFFVSLPRLPRLFSSLS